MEPWHRKRWTITALHILFWMLFVLVPIAIMYKPAEPARQNGVVDSLFLLVYLSNSMVRIGIFYLNSEWLIPSLLFRRRHARFLGWQSAMMVSALAFDGFVFRLLLPYLPFRFGISILFNAFPVLFIVISSIAYRSILDRLQEDRRRQQRETENLRTELSFLRSQVSPHFMFNVLNNMVALARKGSADLEPSLIKLSSLLRYMLYETDERKVPLRREIEYLESYIDLQRQRFGSKLRVETSLPPVDDALAIEPMLLIPFVENAFKHGTGRMQDPYIRIGLTAYGGQLDFTVSNRFTEDTGEVKDATSGIGLANVRRRLDLLYGDAQSLTTEHADGLHSVHLMIKLSEG